MGKLKKTKAVFQIFILIVSIFSISLMNTEDVSAQDKFCCEKTLDSSPYSGQYCVYAELNNCDIASPYTGAPLYKTDGVACEQTDYCKPVCCIQEGECVENTYKAICLDQGGVPQDDASCGAEVCQEGCCVLPDQALFATQVECANLIDSYSGLVLEDVFNPTITDEYTCLQQAQNQEEGCCVKSNSCAWETREECDEGTFYDNTLCSYAPLGCLVTEKHHIDCLEGEEEVYWFDSFGNPENIYGTNYRIDGKKVSKENSCDPLENNAGDINCGNCNYEFGSICSEADDDFLTAVANSNLNDAIKNKLDDMCIDLNCYDLYTDDTNAVRWQSELHGDVTNGFYRVNGESWCQYEGKVGYGYDLVGSRHYRRACINGEDILLEPCAEGRESICVQNIIPEEISNVPGGISGAICRSNLAGPCFGTIEDPIDIKEDCELLEADCYWNGIYGTDKGVCLPFVPFGGFEEEDSAACFGEITALEYWVKDLINWEWKWHCEENCDVNEKSFGDSMFTICRSLGDCGDYYNVLGEESYDAGEFKKGSFRIYKPSGHAYTGIVKGFNFYPYTNFDGNNLGESKDYINGSLFWWMFAGNYLYSGAMNGDFDDPNTLDNLLWTFGGGLGIAGLVSLIVPSLGFIELISWTFGGTATLVGGSFGFTALGSAIRVLGAIAVIGAAIVAIVAVVYWLGADDEEVPFTFTCEKWVPPIGGDDCERCDDFVKCDEYKCSSLGAACKFLENEEACVWENRGDAIPPIITLLPIVPLINANFEPVGGSINEGYRFKNLIAYATDLEIGITTDERAQCKISNSPGTTFDDMTNTFGEGNLYNHTITIDSKSFAGEDEIAITGAGEYNFYVKCMDVNGNQNLNDYFIKFTVEEGEDVMAPLIEDTSIVNGAFMPHNKQNTSLTLYLDDQTGIDGCRYSRGTDKTYELMDHSFNCLNTKIGDYYQCNNLVNITLNQENKYYFRCNDTLGNVNVQGYEFILQSSDALYISDSGPNGDVLTTQVTLETTTSGGAESGISTCYYSLDDFFDPNGLLFQNTGATSHTTELYLQNEQDYLFSIWCRDIAGNEDTSEVSFHTTTLPLNIVSIEPENDSKFYVDNFELEVITTGGVNENGESDCRYDGSLISDKVPGGSQTIHTKNITGLSNGPYNWEIVCEDAIGVENKTHLYFEVELNVAPLIIGIYTTSNTLNIILNREGICKYSNDDPNFDFETEGNSMVPGSLSTTKSAALGGSVYYIKCKDSYGNLNDNNPYIVYP